MNWASDLEVGRSQKVLKDLIMTRLSRRRMIRLFPLSLKQIVSFSQSSCVSTVKLIWREPPTCLHCRISINLCQIYCTVHFLLNTKRGNPKHIKFRTCSALTPMWTPPMNDIAAAGIFKKSMGARYWGGIGFSYRPARLHRLAEYIPWHQFRGPINI
jgi:hypothetical protein